MYPQYMSILLHVELIMCNGIPYIYVNWGGKYMYILLYVKLIWCNGIPYTYCQLEWGVHVSSVYVHSFICET